jgi:small GTP-binding protein
MSDITTKSLYESDIESLGDKYLFLKNADLASSAFSDWYYVNTHELGYKKVKALNVIFIGQTGYGKSSLINKLIKKDIFKTSDYQSCTKILQSANFFLHHKMKHENLAYQLNFVDLPGIGENDKADEQYLQWYKDYIKVAAVIIYLFRADKRDYTQDEFFFDNVFDKNKASHLIYVISQADKIEPLSRGIELSDAQKENLEKKKLDIKNKSFLNFGEIDTIYISSHLNINILDLENKIICKLKSLLQIQSI